MNIKLDNEPYDRGQITIHEDFCISSHGFWLIRDKKSTHFTEESYRWHTSQAQECVDDIIYNMLHY